MFRAVLIDDEHLALIHLENLLKKLVPITIAGVFMDAESAVEQITDLRPDIIFLDIQMPEMNGLEAAERLVSLCPSAEIVFVTAYDNHALEAFELNALDYVLKPLNMDRLSKTVNRIQKRLSHSAANEEPAEVTISMFGSLKISRGSEELPIKWRTQKSQVLFALLFHHVNEFVSNHTLIEQVWPDTDLEKARSYLYTTVYHIRRCLKQVNVDLPIEKTSGAEGYCMRLEGNINLTKKWEQSIRSLDEITPDNEQEASEIIEAYKYDYLKEFDYLWTLSERERLRNLFIHHALKLAAYYTDKENWMEALALYQRLSYIHPYYEEAYLRQMEIYDFLADYASVEARYQTIQYMLQQDLDTAPSAEIRSWYERWKARV
ncbi:response regulator [Paenibacillus xylanilyticus]|uniref:Response regulator n=1 Tax=Paenibacillus xylanilyticus TaxID=248903 RepID=A0A7Y6BVB9_9BACL|nr:response regulator [Paenibacillus xylanilyticus]NUU75675.1 response regulator [Paenibacillus xylanilyticus]